MVPWLVVSWVVLWVMLWVEAGWLWWLVEAVGCGFVVAWVVRVSGSKNKKEL